MALMFWFADYCERPGSTTRRCQRKSQAAILACQDSSQLPEGGIGQFTPAARMQFREDI